MFKSASVFTLDRDTKIDIDTLRQFITNTPLVDCAALQAESWGFVDIVDGVNLLDLQGAIFMRLGTNKKSVPAAAVKQLHAELIAKHTKEHGKAPGKAQKKALKEQALEKLLPRAIQVTSTLNVVIDMQRKLVHVDTGSAKAAETAVQRVRFGLGSLPTKHLEIEGGIGTLLTQWVENRHAESPFELGNSVDMEGAEKAKAKYANHDLTIDTVRANLEDGMSVTKLSLSVTSGRNQYHFDLNEGGVLSKLSGIQESDDRQVDMDDEGAVSFALKASLIEALGGLRDIVKELGQVAKIVWATRDDEAIEEDDETGDGDSSGAVVIDLEVKRGDDADELYMDAVRLVTTKGKASISIVQRGLKIGYNRAARLVEAMEEKGLISGIDSSGSRQVLVTLEQVEQLQPVPEAGAEADADAEAEGEESGAEPEAQDAESDAEPTAAAA